MSIPILIASILTLLAFFVHTFMGDRELKLLEPKAENDQNFVIREKWTMARSGWHWISLDLLLATIVLGMINFTNFFENENTILQLLMVYFLGYGVVWLIGIAISKRFPMNYLKLGQWILLFVIGGLIYLGTS